jgi:hypothetical protein
MTYIVFGVLARASPPDSLYCLVLSSDYFSIGARRKDGKKDAAGSGVRRTSVHLFFTTDTGNLQSCKNIHSFVKDI